MGDVIEVEFPEDFKPTKRDIKKLRYGVARVIDDLIEAKAKREAKAEKKHKHKFGELRIPPNTKICGFGPFYTSLEELPDDLGDDE